MGRRYRLCSQVGEPWVLKPLIPEITEPKVLPECSHNTKLGEQWKSSLCSTVVQFVYLVIADVVNLCFFIKKANTNTPCLQFGSISASFLSPNQSQVPQQVKPPCGGFTCYRVAAFCSFSWALITDSSSGITTQPLRSKCSLY